VNALDLAYLTAAAAISPVLAYKRLALGKYRESVPGMLGRNLPARPLAAVAPPARRVWMHAVSVGESIAAGGIHRELRRRRPAWEHLVTTVTETGQAQARRSLEGADHFSYAPFDFTWTVEAFHRAYQPTVYLLFETEIWPNNLAYCRNHDIPVFIINGKLSERSGRRYARLHRLFRPALSGVRRFFMQTQADAERMARVLGSDDRLEVTGNVKFDALPAPLAPAERADARARWGIAPDAFTLVVGSTHPGEEEILLDAFDELRRAEPGARMILAPRHPERFGKVADLLVRRGLPVLRTSTGESPAPGETPVVLIDQMGVLGRMFGVGDIALLGGSWVPIGGHNLLEPAVHGIPVLRGPHMHAQKEIVRVLGPDRGGPMVEAGSLASELLRLCRDPRERHRLGGLAAEAALSNRGSAARVVDGILSVLGETSQP
jgi:3-deoxy-D-manno-octulosonic-acid transferase